MQFYQDLLAASASEKMDMMMRLRDEIEETRRKAFVFASPDKFVTPLQSDVLKFISNGKCSLCDKQSWGLDSHATSKQHLERVALAVQMDELMGSASIPRTLYRGFTGSPNQQDLLSFWGNRLLDLPVIAREKINRFGLKLNKFMTPGEDVQSLSLGVINYDPTTDRKYDSGENRFIPWGLVPEDRTHEKGQDCARQAGGANAQWWPVLSVQWHPTSATNVWIKSMGLRTECGTWLICVYQLFEMPLCCWIGQWAEMPIFQDALNGQQQGTPPADGGVFRSPSRSSKD